MKIENTKLSGVVVLTPTRHGDERGFFSESYNQKTLLNLGIDINFVQDNHSLSSKTGTVRGLHFQTPPHAQAKLVRCGRGSLFDVAVDARKGSPTYGQWVGETLSFENGKQLLVPVGFLHGFVTLEPDTEIVYKCSDYYSAECDGAVKFNDPDIGIDWGIDAAAAIVSDKDATAQGFAHFDTPFTYAGQSR